MKSVSIKGVARVNLGKKFAKQLRKEDNVPCVIYGGTSDPMHFYAHSNEFRKIVYTADVYIINIHIGDTIVKSIMSDIQFHPVSDKLVHIDFLKISDDQNVRINLPIQIIGNALGVQNGGRMALNMRSLIIEALIDNLPEMIEVDISDLRIGQSIRVSDLKIDGANILSKGNDVIVGIKTSRAVVEEEEVVGTDSETAEGEDGEETKGESKE
jgi:large subunit ribosomal protein L25